MFRKLNIIITVLLVVCSNIFAVDNLDSVHVWPNPCNKYESQDHVTFANVMPVNAEIKIYTISGELVNTINKSSTLSTVQWNLKNLNGDKVVSGIYIYVVKASGMTKSGKVIIIS